MINPAAPDGAPPRRINDGNLLKLPCPAIHKERSWGREPSHYQGFSCFGSELPLMEVSHENQIIQRVFENVLVIV